MTKLPEINYKKMFGLKGDTWQHKTNFALNILAWVLIVIYAFYKPTNLELRYVPFACFIVGYILLKEWYNVIFSSIISTILATVWITQGTIAMMWATLILIPFIIIASVFRYRYLKKKKLQTNS